jgi:hypothetical protein
MNKWCHHLRIYTVATKSPRWPSSKIEYTSTVYPSSVPQDTVVHHRAPGPPRHYLPALLPASFLGPVVAARPGPRGLGAS